MKLSPKLAAAAAALATVPVAAVAASAIPGADQMLAWVVTALVTALVSALAGAITKLTGATLDAKARAALTLALTNAANASIRHLAGSIGQTSWGKRLDLAVDQMMDYVPKGAPGAVARFELATSPEGLAHLRKMAEARLVEQLGLNAPDLLTKALTDAGAPVRTGMFPSGGAPARPLV